MTKTAHEGLVESKHELVCHWDSEDGAEWERETLNALPQAPEGILVLEICLAPEAVEPPGCDAPLSKRVLGALPRTLRLPCVARVGSVSANYHNGILKVRLNGP